MRLLIVEDHAELADAVRASFARRNIHCDLAHNAMDAELMIRTVQYALVILDLGLPDEDGLRLLQRLRAMRHSEPILVLTARSALEARVEGLQAGADDYMLKPFYFDELHARVQAILRREGGRLQHRIVAGALEFDPDTHLFCKDGRSFDLSVREGELLELLMRRLNLVVRKQTLENQLFGSGETLGSNAVEVYIHRLRKRLEAEALPLNIQTVRGVGYMLQTQ
ncbi:MAG TPA: response regulator transcription factor [Sphingobium sp.]|uniref:response regulator transcription factor n=1 Tax=Sphingobium sp. TaxID=1912891 RepID=UPI002ED5A836